MLKHPIVFILLTFITFSAQAQTTAGVRYKDIIFSEVKIDKDLSYNPLASKEKKKAYQFDLDQPKNDDVKNRPLIIWMHGGGFKFGSKNAKGMKVWGESFAKRGYVCAAINYRLSKNNPLFHFDELLKGSYFAVQDAKRAVLYFKEHAKEYNIDPDKIILAGNSAGGIIALQAAYSSNTDLAHLAKLPYTVEGAKNREIFKVAAVINFWGAIFDTSWLKNAHVPIISVLGNKDGVVSPTHKDAPMYGGIDIHKEADALHIPNGLKIFDGYSHELQKHFNPIFPVGDGTRARWLQAGQFAADLLYDNLFK